jgi:hypothetical protein
MVAGILFVYARQSIEAKRLPRKRMRKAFQSQIGADSAQLSDLFGTYRFFAQAADLGPTSATDA